MRPAPNLVTVWSKNYCQGNTCRSRRGLQWKTYYPCQRWLAYCHFASD